MVYKALTPDETTIISYLYNGTDIAFGGNGFDAVTVQPDGSFTTSPREPSGWYTQSFNSRMNQEAVESLIRQGIIRVETTEIGGVLVYTHKLVLA